MCKRLEDGPYKMPPMVPLLKTRVSAVTLFCRTGLYYLGPLHTKDFGILKKIWICLFTCFVTRSLYLGIVSDLTTTSFLFCLQRYIATIGMSSEMVNENAMLFKVADKTLRPIWKNVITSEEEQSVFSNKGIKWSFIVTITMDGWVLRTTCWSFETVIKGNCGKKIIYW